MSPKNFRNISHPEPEISQYLSYFSEEVSQLLTDIQEIQNYFQLVYNSPRNDNDMILLTK